MEVELKEHESYSETYAKNRRDSNGEVHKASSCICFFSTGLSDDEPETVCHSLRLQSSFSDEYKVFNANLQ